MTIPDRTLGDDPTEHLGDHNALHDRYNELTPGGSATERIPAALMGSGTPTTSNFLRGDRTWQTVTGGTGLALGAIRFVAKTGNDANSGFRWNEAKLTIGAAYLSLPSAGTGNAHRREGTIYIGEGLFQEQGIDLHTNIRFIGSGSTYTGGKGTVVQLIGAATDHLFRPRAGWITHSDYAHHVYFEKMTIDGNKANQTGEWNLIDILSGGFNTVFRDVYFTGATGYGVLTRSWLNNIYFINCTAGGCNKGLFHFETAPWMAGFYGGQFSGAGGVENGYASIYVGPSASASAGQIFLDGLKIETNDDTRQETVYVLTYRPRDVGGFPEIITARNVSAANSTPLGGIAVFHEENKGGRGAVWDLQDIDIAGSGKYRHVFWSEKTGQKTIPTPTTADNYARRVNQARFMHRVSSDAVYPLIEIMGVGIDAGPGSPEGVVGRPVGSQWMQSDGGVGTTLYVKESGPPVAAQGTLTMDTNPTDGDTLTVGVQVYTFQTTLTDAAGNVQIGAAVADTQANLVAAFARTGTSGTQYAEATIHHIQVTMAAFTANVAVLTARVAGVSGNLFATTETFTAGTNVFNGATLGTTTAGSDGKTGWVAK